MEVAVNEVHIWSSSLNINENQIQEQTAILNDLEIARAERFYFPQHRQRFIAAHSFLRYVLSNYLNISPADIEIKIDAQGKPYLPDNHLQFNLSHSSDMVALAISSNNPLGIDIEFIKPTFDAGIAKSYFHQDEIAALNKKAQNQQAAFFYNLWARKEALIKANGKGLSLPLNEFSTISSNDPEIIVLEENKWHLYSVTLHPMYASALATLNKIFKISYWQWQEQQPRLHQFVEYT